MRPYAPRRGSALETGPPLRGGPKILRKAGMSQVRQPRGLRPPGGKCPSFPRGGRRQGSAPPSQREAEAPMPARRSAPSSSLPPRGSSCLTWDIPLGPPVRGALQLRWRVTSGVPTHLLAHPSIPRYPIPSTSIPSREGGTLSNIIVPIVSTYQFYVSLTFVFPRPPAGVLSRSYFVTQAMCGRR